MKQKLNSGQALLIVLLSMSVVLTIVLSVLARSITDVFISSQDEDSLRAFSAAEAGVERALIIGAGIESTAIGNASYNVNVSSVAEGEKEFNYPTSLFSGESATIWFVNHDQDKNFLCSEEKPCFKGDKIKVCWREEGSNLNSSNTPALELSIFYTQNLVTKIARAAIDPNLTRIADNRFSGPDEGNCVIDGHNYLSQKIIEFDLLNIPQEVYLSQGGQLQFMFIRSLYNLDQGNNVGVSVDFSGNSTLPSQGQKIVSFGLSGNTNRKIEVQNNFGEIPDVFSFAVYSQAGVSK